MDKDKDKNNLPVLMVKEFFLGLGRVSIVSVVFCAYCKVKRQNDID